MSTSDDAAELLAYRKLLADLGKAIDANYPAVTPPAEVIPPPVIEPPPVVEPPPVIVQPPSTTGRKALMSDTAADTVGLNTHINFFDTVYYRNFATMTKPRLIELGVRHIRDNAAADANTDIKMKYTELGQAGIKILMQNGLSAAPIHNYCDSINPTNGPFYVEAIEPRNEWDIRSATYASDLATEVKANYPAMQANAQTRGLIYMAPAFANSKDKPAGYVAAMPNSADYCDRGNTHDYGGVAPESSRGGGWGISVAQMQATAQTVCSKAKKVWATENGYKTAGGVNGFPETTERASAKYMLRNILHHINLGFERFYIYELIKWNQESFGILNDGGTGWKQQGQAVKNFLALFSDKGADFDPGYLDYTLEGTTTNVHSSLFQKRDGRFLLALWQGVNSCDGGVVAGSARDVEPPAVALTLKLQTPVKTVRTFDPTFSSSATNVSAGSSISLSVHDYVMVVELTPA